MLSNRAAITQRAMFMRELNDALKTIKTSFGIENLDVVTDTDGDVALELAIKIGFMFKWFYILVIIGGGFVKSVAFLEGTEVKRFNFQYEKLTMMDGINKTVQPLYSYCIDNDGTKSKPSASLTGQKANKTTTTTTEDSDWSTSVKGKILTDSSKGSDD
jgi:hypothetical protein